MLKRNKKKLLLGLGFCIFYGINFSVVYVVLRSINNFNDKDNILLNEAKRVDSISELPDYNVATKDMFIETKNLRFHLGNVGTGQTITPFGWLGTYTKKNGSNYGESTLTLTSWNGEVLWVNNQNDKKIYDAKYNFLTKQIYVIRTDDSSGLSNLYLTIHDVETGKIFLTHNLNINFKNELNNNDNISNYSAYQDFVTLGDNSVIWYYTFDFNKFTHLKNSPQKKDNQNKCKLTKELLSKLIKFKLVDNNKNNLSLESLEFDTKGFKDNEHLLISPYLTYNANKIQMNWNQVDLSTKKTKHLIKEINSTDLKKNKKLTMDNANELSNDSIYVKKNLVKIASDFECCICQENNNKTKESQTRPTRNMFDQNVITIPYIYGYVKKENKKIPLYNVVQLNNELNSSYDKYSDKKNICFNFGEQIMNFANNKNQVSDDIFKRKFSLNSNSKQSITSQLIAVSPFDNTVIYSFRPDSEITWNNEKKHFDDLFSSFYVATNDVAGQDSPYRLFLISGIANKEVPKGDWIGVKKLLNKPSDLYDNLTFDLRGSSRQRSYYDYYDYDNNNNSNAKGSLALYFNLNVNDNESDISKIGIIDLKNIYNWSSDITYSKTNENYFNSLVQHVSSRQNIFTYLISMADLKKWYPRTWHNANKGSNILQNDVIISNSSNQRTKVTSFGIKLTGYAFESVSSVDLVSDYYDSPYKNTAILWKPTIVANNKKSDSFNGLNLKVIYKPNITTENSDFLAIHKDKFIFEKKIKIENASKLILSTLRRHVKIKSMKGSSNNIQVEVDYGDPTIGTYANTNFGSINNSLVSKNKNALRLELKIDSDKGDINSLNEVWDPPEKFTKTYPITTEKNEKTFDKILKEYIEWKTKNLVFLSFDESGDFTSMIKRISLSSLSIKAYLRLNPEITTPNSTIYKISTDKYGLSLNDTKQLIIYDDKTWNHRWIYDLSSLNFNDNKSWGWIKKSDKTKSFHIDELYKGLVPGVNINSNSKFLINVDPNDLNDIFFRDKDKNKSLSLNAEYVEDDKIKIDLDGHEWKSRFASFNQMIGLKLCIEGKERNNNTWKEIAEATDYELYNKFLFSENWEIKINDRKKISKIRFRLKNISEDDPNIVISKYKESDLDNAKFISDEYYVKPQRTQHNAVYLKSEWLDKIQLSGNTKNITINESEVTKKIEEDNLFSGYHKKYKNEIKIEYSFDSINWYDKNDFAKELVKLDGAKDLNNFILKRESIVARFNLKNPDLNLNIDNTNVDYGKGEYAEFTKVLVNDNKNLNFKGYINVNKLSGFVADNFSIKGSTNHPKFFISNFDKLNNLLNIYASSNIFEIKFTTTLKSDGTPDYSNQTHQLWNPNTGLISEDGLIKLGIKIQKNDKFFVGFFAKDKYDVYHNDKKEDPYTLKIKNIKILSEIENPFTKENMKLGLLFTDENNKPKFYQNHGGFKLITIKDNKINNNQSAQSFLQNLEEKDIFEFVYKIFYIKPSNSEWKELISGKNINDYSLNSKWKSLPDKNADDFISDLNLKVNQYVAVALRVKEEYANKENGYTLKDDDFSVTELKNGRVHGYKIKVSDLSINWDDFRLINFLDKKQELLDGFTIIQNLSLNSDTDENYLGVKLKLNLFNEFWVNNQDQPIVINDNVKLVKRKNDEALPNQGNYVSEGNEVRDKNGESIPILIDKHGLPTKIKEENNVTRSKLLTEIFPGNFSLENVSDISKFLLFREQKIQIEYVAKSGLAENGLSDFYLDDETNNKVDYILDKKIKYPLNNKNNVNYEFDQSILNNIVYKNQKSKKYNAPVNGWAQIVSPIKVIRSDFTRKLKVVSGVNNLEKMLKDDFDGLLKFQFKYINIYGKETIYDGIDILKLENLRNTEKIIINIVSNTENWMFTNTIKPLVITVKNLLEESPKFEHLQYLRVIQKGNKNGKGLFRVFVNNPENDSENESLLKGYKFALRVWSPDRKIKIHWTTDQSNIKGLSNGDKVEWKLITDKNQPVIDSYYNTISNGTSIDKKGNIIYHFSKIWAKGNHIIKVVKKDIGKLPEDELTYPEESGFIIDGLVEEKYDDFVMKLVDFKNIINELNPYYVGFDGQGAIRFGFLDDEENQRNLNNLYITSDGKLINENNEEILFSKAIIQDKPKMKLVDFINKISFTATNTSRLPTKLKPVPFKYSFYNTNLNNKLFNGNYVYASFPLNNLTTYVGKVNGLGKHNDLMNKLWYIIFAILFISTIGIFFVVYIYKKDKKLK